MADQYVDILTPDDVTEEVLQDVWSVVEGWYLDTPVDWEDVFERVERSGPAASSAKYDFGSSWDSPAIRKIKRVIRQWKQEATL